jgi:hypothetical protein
MATNRSNIAPTVRLYRLKRRGIRTIFNAQKWLAPLRFALFALFNYHKSSIWNVRGVDGTGGTMTPPINPPRSGTLKHLVGAWEAAGTAMVLGPRIANDLEDRHSLQNEANWRVT